MVEAISVALLRIPLDIVDNDRNEVIFSNPVPN
jgi:hypothetical protein